MHEIKFDGYRTQAHLQKGLSRLELNPLSC